MDEIASFGRWVQIRRETLRLTRKKLAGNLGCASVTIKKIERDERRPSKLIAQLLVVHLKISPSIESKFIRWARGAFVTGMPPPDQLSFKGDSPHRQRPQQQPEISNNLPELKTSFIGRIEELASVNNLFQNPKVRLITLVGPGGIGKTRLAHQAAHQALAQAGIFSDGALFIDLANLQTADQLVIQVAAALQLSFSGISPPKDQVRDRLQNKNLLLFLDNFEQLFDSATGLLEEWLGEIKQVKFLVTSREPLNLVEEWIVKIEGLSFPSQMPISPTIKSIPQLAAPDMLTQTYPAVALFVNRARQMVHDFSLDEDVEAQRAVLQICRLLEGIPLAIELAAPWVRMMSCEDIFQEIQRSFDFLATKFRNIDPRHRSMRAVFEQSWRLLTAVEQTLLAQLSVFNGRFQREAAMSICGASLLDLAALVDKSLIQTTDNHIFRLHPLLKQFATEKLPPDETETVRHAHARYYANFLDAQKSELGGTTQATTLQKVGEEIENIKAAWYWQVQNDNVEEMIKSFYTIYSYHSVRGRFLEGKVLFETAVNQLHTLYKNQTIEDDDVTLLLVEINTRLGEFYYSLGQLAAAEEKFQEGIYFNKLIQSNYNLAYCYYMLGNTKRLQGYYLESQTWLQQALDLLDKEKEEHLHAFLLAGLGVVEKELGNLTAARTFLNKSIELFEKINYQFGLAHTLRHLGAVACLEKHIAAAQNYFEKSLKLCSEIKDKGGIAMALNQLGRLKQQAGDYQSAQGLYQIGLELGSQIQQPIVQIRTLKSLGHLMNVSAEYGEAQQFLRQALHKSAKAQAIPEALTVILEMASGYLLQGQAKPAQPLMHLALQHPASSWEIQEEAVNLQNLLPTDKTFRTVELFKAPSSIEAEKSLLSILAEAI